MAVFVPKGFIGVDWEQVPIGAKVYVTGRAQGHLHAFGPFTVEKAYRLRNEAIGTSFTEYQQDLCIPEDWITETKNGTLITWQYAATP